MIAHAFPPEGHAGTYRPLRFVRQLPALGWLPTVISLKTESYHRYDPSLVSQIPNAVQVIRVPDRDLWKAFQHWRRKRIDDRVAGDAGAHAGYRGGHGSDSARSRVRDLVRRIEAACYHPDPEMGWIRPATKATLDVCATQPPAVIWATAGPVSAFCVAENVSLRTGIPYVLDFRDAWTITYNEFEDMRPAWAKRLEERRMFRQLARARAVIFRSRAEAECYWRAYNGAVRAPQVHIIPNGYEGTIEPFVPMQSGRCEVLYTGTLADYRYDTLLKALARLRRESPHIASRVHFTFVGEDTGLVAAAARALDLDDIITTRGPVSQASVSQLTRQAHALLILARPATVRGYELFSAAKLYGYLRTGMPILGVVPEDETKHVLQHVGATTVADVDSEPQIAAVIARLVETWSQGAIARLAPDPFACESYSAERQTAQLVRALQGHPADDPFLPGATPIPASLRAEISRRQRERARARSDVYRDQPQTADN